MDGLHDIIRAVTDPIVVLHRVVEQSLVAVPHADGAAVELLRAGQFEYVSAGGSLTPFIGTSVPEQGSLSGAATSTGEIQCALDTDDDARVNREACRRVGARSLLCVPLRRGIEPVGVLKVTAGHPDAFDDADVTILARLAEFVSVSITAAADIARVATEAEAWDSPAGTAFVANVLHPGSVDRHAASRRVERVLADDAFTVVCQPIVALDSGALVGAEALARFPQPPAQGPDAWFAEAYAAGLGVALELAAIRKAVTLMDHLPHGTYLTVNVGPEVLATPELHDVVVNGRHDPARLVLELTEHFAVEDYERLRHALCGLRRAGARLAIDDTGAGFASLAHILKLSPDIIKLDRDLARGIDQDPIRRSLAAALVAFAGQTGAQVVAEGLETTGELAAVRELGIGFGQGYLLGRPGAPAALAPLADAA
jgi:EAL domain-containing protein (putative c-di-GMP-specific phosphodiesterase class I)